MWARGKPGRKARAAFMNVACVYVNLLAFVMMMAVMVMMI